MPRSYLFADESGDFTFSNGANISRYFIVCTVTMSECTAEHTLLELRRDMVWRKLPVRDYFHATTDKQVVRDEVFSAIAEHKFRVQATIMEKCKAQSQVRITNARFYKYGWLYHFRNSLAPYLGDDDELLITTASIGTKKGQGVFTDAVNDVVQQHVPRERWATFSAHLQIADYCTWAIQRKWKRGDSRAYDIIKDRISYEFDLWKHGSKRHY